MLLELFYKLDCNIYSLLLLLAIAGITFKNIDLKMPINKYLQLGTIVLIFQLVLEGAIYILQMVDISIKSQAIFLINSLMYVCGMVVPVCLIIFIMYYLNYTKYINTKKMMLFIPIVIALVFVVMNVFTPCLFRVKDNGEIVNGVLYNYYILVAFVYIIIAAIVVKMNRKRLSDKEYFVFLSFAAVPMIGAGFQFFIPIRFLVWPFVATTMCLVLFFLQTNITQYDILTKFWNKDKAERYLEDINDEKKYKVTVLYIDYYSLKNIYTYSGEKAVYENIKKIANIIQRSVNLNSKKVRYDVDKFMVIYLNTNREQIEEDVKEILRQLEELPKGISKITYIIDEYSEEKYETNGQYLRSLEMEIYDKKYNEIENRGV